ncbi:MAG TPA: type II toxin-antitoxin system HicB family antitoxin [Firmicutes bacterium]|nr:type II toxin-antitoxin system HicB family antitoxin [Bacillota bacterium]
MELKYTVILEVDEDGHYIAAVPALKGCHSFGRTREEALQRVREAIELYLECLAEDKRPFPPDIETDALNVGIEIA